MLGVLTAQEAHLRLQFTHWPVASMKVAAGQEQVLEESVATDLHERQLLAAAPLQVAQLEWQTIAAQLPLPSIVKPALQVQALPPRAALFLQEEQVVPLVQVLQVLAQGWQTPAASM